MNSSIKNLPVKLLIGILRLLDQASLKEAILTCDRWKQVIVEHCSWSIRFCANNISQLTVSRLLNTRRRLHIEMIVFRNINSTKIDIFKPIGCGIVELFWNSTLAGDESQFREVLKWLPNLEYIELRLITLEQARDTDDCDLPDLEKLKTLKTFKCSDSIFKCFRTSGLESLEVHLSLSTSSMQHAVNFVLRQNNLTRFTVILNSEDSFFQQLCHATPNGTVLRNLTHLILNAEDHSNNYVGLIEFVEMHSETLRELELRGIFSDAIYEIVFGELNCLKLLTLRDLSEETDFGMNLNENRSIEDLTLVNNNLSPVALGRLCNCVPNVKNLFLNQYSNSEQLQIISTALSKLTTLCVFRKCDGNFNKIKFPNLSSFYITHLSYEDVDWYEFSKSNSGITEIVIQYVEDFALNLDHIEMITRNLKLQTLKIGNGFLTNQSFLSIIDKNCSDLKVLDLHKSCGIKDLRRNNSYAARLRLCNKIEFPYGIRLKCPW